MFRLNDAVRRYQAQHQTRPALRSVATSVAASSPSFRAASTRNVATVAVVATPILGPVDIGQLIHQLREEGVMLRHQQNALIIRPTHWQQVNKISAHWKAVLRFLQDTENGEADGIGRPA
ncbi:hypothetical protein IQK56_21090 [Pseudomonas sp. MAFF 301449]|uniref:Uncharacterized protein n=1 Tax=Pseudomonas cyclaminis TaxID=2781239 RepID=A0ABR9SWB1_9PSED|nr:MULTISPECIES: hypothetical protein [Pseudomonas fluorescens group]KJH84094.1 hypothetical protein UG46_22425 [Pseudomonas fluorescens]MBE8593210.1 hypothetical protein [Pseudomonas cyclaminis]MBE8602376.1 hypothetical protein [Pseudomonas cyclaminis]